MQLASQEFWPRADASSLCTTSWQLCVIFCTFWEHFCTLHIEHSHCTLHNALCNAQPQFCITLFAHYTMHQASLSTSYPTQCTMQICASLHTIHSYRKSSDTLCFAICTMCKRIPPCTMCKRSQQMGCMRSLKNHHHSPFQYCSKRLLAFVVTMMIMCWKEEETLVDLSVQFDFVKTFQSELDQTLNLRPELFSHCLFCSKNTVIHDTHIYVY